MKKTLVFLLCLLFAIQATASDFEITDDYTVVVDKEALLASLLEADITSIREAIDLGLISCTELTAYYLERIETYNDTFQCFITLCDNALEAAAQRDAAIEDGTAQGSLFGIPIVVKDNIDYEGYPTTNGLWSSYQNNAAESATVVQYLLDEGAVILGKTNMSAAAQDALCSINAVGLQTFNAYDPNLASGGSSGGSAVAVSLNFAVAGLGTDTNASLRYPSALNGCVSMRPTFGLLNRDGCVVLNYSRDTAGAITRNVMDQAIMLDVMSGSVNHYAKNLNPNILNGMRIGVLSELSYPTEGSYNRKDSDLDDEIQAAFDNAVVELTDCGAEIVTVSMPTIFSDIANSGNTNDRLYAKLENILTENNISALIYPTYLHTPQYTTSEYLKGKSIYDLPYICNCATLSPLTGAPEITVPIGTHSRGAGIGMEIISLKNSEQLLLDIAYSYTQMYDHRQVPQTAPNLYYGEQDVTLEEFLELYRLAQEQAAALEIAATETEPSAETEPITIEVTEPEQTAPPVETPPNEQQPNYLWYLTIPIVTLIFISVGFYRKRRKRIATANSSACEENIGV